MKKEVNQGNYSKYRVDPVGFCRDVLKQTFTPDVNKLLESVRDNQITIAQSANATGKTHGAARAAIWWYKCYPDGGHVYTASAPPESNLRDLLWGEISKVYMKNLQVFEEDKLTYLKISGEYNSFVKGVTIPTAGSEAERETKFSGKHASHLFFILDEGDAIPDEIYRGVESCMSGGKNRLLIMFNPRRTSGTAYRLIKEGVANVVILSAFNHPNVIEGHDIIPGAVSRSKTVERIVKWCRQLEEDEPSDEATTFSLPEYLEGLRINKFAKLKKGRYKITNPAFSYMVLGKYPSAGDNSLISREWIDKARGRWDLYVSKFGEIPPIGVKGIMGQDVADMGQDKNVSCFRYGGFVERFVSWRGVDMSVSITRATVEYNKRKLICCNVDSTGVGAGIAPGLKRNGCNARRVMVASKSTEKTDMGNFQMLRDQLWWSIREWLRIDDTAMLPPNNDLIDELSCVTYDVSGKVIKIMPKKEMKKILRRSPDFADALCLTFANSKQRVFIS